MGLPGDRSRWRGVTAFTPCGVGWPRAPRGRVGTRGSRRRLKRVGKVGGSLLPGPRRRVRMGQTETG